MDDDLKRKILEKTAGLDIDLTGFAPAFRWNTPLFEHWIPEAFRPASIVPETRTVIVIGIPVHLPALETAPSIWYHELYKTVNTLLDTSAYRIASFLNREGFPSVAIPRDGYGSISILKEKPVAFFSHRHAALLAGLGTFGINNVLLTKRFGPRVRFASIFTSAEITPDPLLGEDLCTRCMQCAAACPVRALPGRDYPLGITDKAACATRSEALNRRSVSPCGLCIRVCPIGEDRKKYGREDPRLYDEKEPASQGLIRAWNHVRAFGGK